MSSDLRGVGLSGALCTIKSSLAVLLYLLDESWTPTMSSYKTPSVSGRSIDLWLFCGLAFNSHVKALSF